MKKILSLILILVMSVCSFGAYAEDYSSKSLGELCDIYTDVLHELFIKMQESGDAILTHDGVVYYSGDDLEQGSYMFLNLSDKIEIITITSLITNGETFEAALMNCPGRVVYFELQFLDKLFISGPGILLRTDSLPRP